MTATYENLRTHHLVPIIKEIIYLSLGALLTLCWLLFLFVSIPVYIYRHIVILLAKRYRPDLGDVLNPLSTCFSHDLYSGQPPRCSIVVCITFEGSIDKEMFNRRAMTHWINKIDEETGELKFPMLQQYPAKWLGCMFFHNTPEPFDIKNHVSYHDNLGSKTVSKQDLDKFTEYLLNQKFPPRKSPWEAHFVGNYRNEELYPNQNLCVLFWKTHHSLGDGYSLLSALVEDLLDFPIPKDLLPTANLPKRTGWKLVKYLLSFPLNLLYEGPLMFSHVFRFNPWKAPDHKKAWHQYCIKSSPISIQEIKDIKNTFGVSFTSVLLSAISAGAHKNLSEKKRNGELSPNDNTDNLVGLSVIPIPGHPRRMTNHATAILFELPTIYYSTPVKRLKDMEAMVERTKSSVLPYSARLYTYSLGAHLAIVSSWIIKRNFLAFGLTNFPSIPITIQAEGNTGLEVDFVVGALEGAGGVAICALSFNQHIRICVSVEKALMTREEATTLVKNMVEEIDVLRDEARASRKLID